MLSRGGGHIPQRRLRRSQRFTVGSKLRLRLRELRQAGEHGGAAGAGAAGEGASRVEVVALQGDAPRLHRAVEGHPLCCRRILQGLELRVQIVWRCKFCLTKSCGRRPPASPSLHPAGCGARGLGCVWKYEWRQHRAVKGQPLCRHRVLRALGLRAESKGPAFIC